jgi:hypothetical protein
MADLDISTVDLTGTAKAVTVNVDLVDSTGTKLAGTVTATGASVVVPMALRTDADGLLTLDLVPNASITPANTYYSVRIKGTTWIISKGAGAETILEALVVAPEPLGTLGVPLMVSYTGAVSPDESPPWSPFVATTFTKARVLRASGSGTVTVDLLVDGVTEETLSLADTGTDTGPVSIGVAVAPDAILTLEVTAAGGSMDMTVVLG